MKKVFSFVILLLVLSIVLVACGKDQADGDGTVHVKVGISAGHEEDIWGLIKELVREEGIDLEIVTFNDYIQPNLALAEGELDINAFQHLPYLEQFNADRGLDLVRIADTLNYPMGVYSNKVTSISEIKEGDTLAIPNDPTNGARALILFENAGLIKLKEGVGIKATVRDIVENPLNLKFQELEAPFLPKALDDVAAAVINTNFALENGLIPTRDAIFIEPKDSPWVNIIAARKEDQNREVFQKIINAYHSDEVKKLIEEKFGDFIVPSW